MGDFKQELNALYAKHKQELQTAIDNYLIAQFKEYFEKYPAVKSVKINAEQSYNDSDYSDTVYKDSECIKINGYNYMDLDGEDWEDDECVENMGLTREQHENLASEASAIFAQINDNILLHVYGTSFGLKIEPIGITRESSDIEVY